MYASLCGMPGSDMSVASARTKARLRLQAGISMLHLATVEAFSNEITANFILVAITIQVRIYVPWIRNVAETRTSF